MAPMGFRALYSADLCSSCEVWERGSTGEDDCNVMGWMHGSKEGKRGTRLEEVDGPVLVVDALESEGDPDAPGGRGAEVAVQDRLREEIKNQTNQSPCTRVGEEMI